MEFNDLNVQDYLKQTYQGRESFLENIIYPIFGRERFEDGFDAEVLEDEELKSVAQKSGIDSIIRYGELAIDLATIHIFDITVCDKVLLARNRVAVQRIVRRLMGAYTGAFMIFHYKGEQSWDWRFSFCCKDDKNVTEAKRYTFLLGPRQACRTAAQNFVKLADVARSGRAPTMTDLVRAFDVEALSREFFTKYKLHYEGFVKYVTGKSFRKIDGKWREVDDGSSNEAMYNAFGRDDKRVRDYVKKLLGRIVFLHFLQKKGWLGADADWRNGDPEFMLHLYQRSNDIQKGNYLDAVLEPLFANALDTDRRAADDLYDTGVVGVGRVKVPYLNGGLFTRDAADEIDSVFPRDYFRNLLAFLAEYNFTIDENDPNDAEVGVDPEMLSCIFENLLEDNRDKGAYYTPKANVEYMCRRSLTAYLSVGLSDADREKVSEFVWSHDAEKLPKRLVPVLLKKLKNVKVCDPAIGSGAFPMGMLREIYFCRVALGDTTSASQLKKEIIENNIYGVDIEKGAVDIARLRFWLALVVEEDTPHALPNLDFKIMQGNSLLENYKGVDLSGLLLANVAAAKRKAKQGKLDLGKIVQSVSQGELAFGGDSAARIITDKMRQYYSETDHQTKKSLMRDIGEQVNGFIKAQINNSALNAEIDALGPQNDRFFLWHTWFNDVFAQGGFDIVIGNPPYIKEYVCKAAFDGFRETSPYYMGKMDLWYGFACHGIDMLAPHGILCFIAQNNWTTSSGAKKMRKKVVQDTKILEMMDFNEYMVFSEDNPDGPQVQTMIMMFERDEESDHYTFDDWTLGIGANKAEMRAMLAHKDIPVITHITPKIDRAKNIKGLLTFSGDSAIFDKISEGKTYLFDEEVAQGIVFPQDFLNKAGVEKLGAGFSLGMGIFGLSGNELDALELNDVETALIKPYYTSDQIALYYTNPVNNLWMIYTDSSFKQPESMNSYPTLKEHLDRFQPVITSSNKPYGLHRARNEHFFKGPKIVAQRKCVARPVFSYSDFDCYVTQTYFVIQTDRWDMKFLTGVLNSRLIAYWLRHRGKMQGVNYQLDKEPLMAIPLPELERSEQMEISGLVAQILAAKAADPDADTTAIEATIDNLVYDLYELTEDEIEQVEAV